MIYKKDDPNFNPNTMGWTTFNGRLGGRSDIMNTDGITGLPDKSWFNDGDNIDEKFYKPPPIIGQNVYGIYKFLNNFILTLIIYLVFYFVNYSLNKHIFPKTTDSFILQSIITSFIVLVLYYIYERVGKYLLSKFVPS